MVQICFWKKSNNMGNIKKIFMLCIRIIKPSLYYNSTFKMFLQKKEALPFGFSLLSHHVTQTVRQDKMQIECTFIGPNHVVFAP